MRHPPTQARCSACSAPTRAFLQCTCQVCVLLELSPAQPHNARAHAFGSTGPALAGLKGPSPENQDEGAVCVCLCVCVTRSRPRGHSKSGRPANIESMKKTKTSHHRIEKWEPKTGQHKSGNRITQTHGPLHGPVKITHADRDSHYTTTGKKIRHNDSPNTTATKKTTITQLGP